MSLKNTVNALWTARVKWYFIGLELNISPTDLDFVKHDETDNGYRLVALLRMWLKRTEPGPSWDAVLEALKSPTVGEEGLAAELAKKHCPTTS